MNISIKRGNMSYLEQIDYIETSLEYRILSKGILNSTLNNNNYYYLVAIVNNNVVGYICAEFLIDHFDILSIAILKDFKGQHIASKLLEEFFKISCSLNIHDIFLEVRESNFAAIKLYEKFNFKLINTRKKYYSDTEEDAYIYKKIV